MALPWTTAAVMQLRTPLPEVPTPSALANLSHRAERGYFPATLVTGSPFFLRPLVGLAPPGGHHLHFVAIDLGRSPSGELRD